MIIRTFYNQIGIVNRIVYELPRHEEIHKNTKMTLIEKDGRWYVIAQKAKSHVPCEKTRTEL